MSETFTGNGLFGNKVVGTRGRDGCLMFKFQIEGKRMTRTETAVMHLTRESLPDLLLFVQAAIAQTSPTTGGEGE